MNIEDRKKLARAYIQDGVIYKTKYVFILKIYRKRHDQVRYLKIITKSGNIKEMSDRWLIEWCHESARSVINEILSSDIHDPKLDKLCVKTIMES